MTNLKDTLLALHKQEGCAGGLPNSGGPRFVVAALPLSRTRQSASLQRIPPPLVVVEFSGDVTTVDSKRRVDFPQSESVAHYDTDWHTDEGG